MVEDLYGAGTNSNPRGFTEFGGDMYFVALTPSGQAELHVTDGTAAGTGLFVNLSGANSSLPDELTVVGSQMSFRQLATMASESFTRRTVRPQVLKG